MTNVTPRFAPLLSQLGYSYWAVLVAVAIGGFFPNVAGALLAPALAGGMLVLGIAHGACDQLVLPASQPAGSSWLRLRYLIPFLLGYLGLAGIVVLLWWRYPAATVSLFFLLTVWHWGSADVSQATSRVEMWLSHSLLRGTLVFVVPALCWPTAMLHIIDSLLVFAGASPLPTAVFHQATAILWPIVVGGHLILWSVYAIRREWQLLRTDLWEVSLLAALFSVLPPMLSVGVYFIFWHSLQHVLRLNPLLGYATPTQDRPSWRHLAGQLWFFTRRALPLLLVSCVALVVIFYLMSAKLADTSALFSLALVVASVLTLPHALLVTLVLDVGKWSRSS